jgi:Uma2 family endonuclease
MITQEIETLINSELITKDHDTSFTISNISWFQYETLLNQLNDSSAFRIKYLDGVLTIMAPSRNHEMIKKRMANLLEIYCVEKDINYYPTGSTTFRKEEKRGGLEPDESYCFETLKDYPDLAIEVIFTSGSLASLKIYQKLGVKEVWFWENDQLYIYYLAEENQQEFSQTFGYKLVKSSQLLPQLNIENFTEWVKHPHHLTAVKQFRQSLKL